MNAFIIEELYSNHVLAAVQNLKLTAQRLYLSMAQLALVWVLRDSQGSSAIIGASRPEQVEDNAAASGFRLSNDVLREIDEVLAPVLPPARLLMMAMGDRAIEKG